MLEQWRYIGHEGGCVLRTLVDAAEERGPPQENKQVVVPSKLTEWGRYQRLERLRAHE